MSTTIFALSRGYKCRTTQNLPSDECWVLVGLSFLPLPKIFAILKPKPHNIQKKRGDDLLKTELQTIARNEPVMKDIVPLANINLIEILYSSILTIAEEEKSKTTED